MLAVVKDREGPGFTLKEVDVPSPRDDQVLVRVKAAGVCGTDIPILDGIRQVPLPLIPGHEFAGVIEMTGSKVSDFKAGDRVSAGLVIGCGECPYCMQGMECLCDSISETGIHVDGAFAEYVAVPAKTLHLLPEGMTYEHGASIDPVASAYRAVKKASLNDQEVAVVFGPGPIGLYAIQIARVEGARTVINVGVKGDERRLEIARRLGADYVILVEDQDPVEAVREITGGRMADVVIEATGRPEVFDTLVQVVRKNGRIVLAGIFHDAAAVSLGPVVRKEIAVYGSICYTWRDFHESMDLVHAGRVRVDPVVTHRLPLPELGRAVDLIRRKVAVKVMLVP